MVSGNLAFNETGSGKVEGEAITHELFRYAAGKCWKERQVEKGRGNRCLGLE